MLTNTFKNLFVLILLAGFAVCANAADDKKKGEQAEQAEDDGGSKREALQKRLKEFERTNRYIHKWIPMPPIIGSRLGVSGTYKYTHRKGRYAVVVFLASWSEPSQQMMKELTKIQDIYEPLDTDFIYVFAHDTRGDAEGFMKHFDISMGLLANDKVLSSYKVSNLPTIFVADRNGWLAEMYIDAKTQDIADLRLFLKKQTTL